MTGEGMDALCKWIIIGGILNIVATPYFATKRLIKKLLPKKVPFVAVLVEHPMKRGYYLAVSRHGKPDDFNLPGGKVEKGESLKEAASRELREETGVYALNMDKVYVAQEETAQNEYCAVFQTNGPWSTEHLFNYSLETKAPNSEGCAVKWTTKEGLCKGSFANYNKAMFQHLGP